MPRFYCQQPLASGATIALPDAVAHHVRVVRLQPQSVLTLFNGEGGQFEAQLVGVDKKGATAVIGAYAPADSELRFAVTLAQALPEASKMDWIIEKAVELGVASIAPIAAQRSVVKLSGERAEKRHAHWQGVIVAASEQSGRDRIARLRPVNSLAGFLGNHGGSHCLLLSPRAGLSLAAWARGSVPQDVTLMVGPEGGFTNEEEAQMIAAGAVPLSMGPRVLRTETAALAALATLSALWSGM